MFVEAANESEIGEGRVKGAEVQGVDIVLTRVQGELFAVEGICTHVLAFLSEGEMEGFELVCPLHAGAFDVRTGVATRQPCIEPIKCYPIRIEDGAVLVDVDNPREGAK
jgi:nitrite reductase/ring-hydroxylating ferredoxin subunit